MVAIASESAKFVLAPAGAAEAGEGSALVHLHLSRDEPRSAGAGAGPSRRVVPVAVRTPGTTRPDVVRPDHRPDVGAIRTTTWPYRTVPRAGRGRVGHA